MNVLPGSVQIHGLHSSWVILQHLP